MSAVVTRVEDNGRVTGVARIGKSGTKLHPAYRENGRVYFLCHCKGTQNGSASNRVRLFSTTLPRTCGNGCGHTDVLARGQLPLMRQLVDNMTDEQRGTP